MWCGCGRWHGFAAHEVLVTCRICTTCLGMEIHTPQQLTAHINHELVVLEPPEGWDMEQIRQEEMIISSKLIIDVSGPNKVTKPLVDTILRLLRAFRVKNCESNVRCNYRLTEK